jgi:hypothetical protein
MRQARDDERTDGAVHDYLVLYPSGHRFHLTGVFGLVTMGGESGPYIRTAPDTLCVLDPRCVVSRDGLVIYDPRHVRSMTAEFRAGLDEHPEWPRLATEGGHPAEPGES